MTEPCLCWRSFHLLGPSRAKPSHAKPSQASPCHLSLSSVKMACAPMPCQRGPIYHHWNQLLSDSCAYKAVLLPEISPLFFCENAWACLLIDWVVVEFRGAAFKVCLGRAISTRLPAIESLNPPLFSTLYFRHHRFQDISSFQSWERCCCRLLIYTCKILESNYLNEIIIVKPYMLTGFSERKGQTLNSAAGFKKIIRFLLMFLYFLLFLIAHRWCVVVVLVIPSRRDFLCHFLK